VTVAAAARLNYTVVGLHPQQGRGGSGQFCRAAHRIGQGIAKPAAEGTPAGGHGRWLGEALMGRALTEQALIDRSTDALLRHGKHPITDPSLGQQ
jgi:hypothetical protein